MFDGGEQFWPEEAPFRTPVFMVTHEVRGPSINRRNDIPFGGRRD